MCVDAGAGDASDEDVPLSTLAERHPAQPHGAAEAPQSQTENAAGSEAINAVDKAPATAAAQPVVEAPASSKATSRKPSQAAASDAAQYSIHSEAGTSASEATPALGSRGSPEPRPAPPAAAVELRTTRSRSKRMSTDASPSVSIASKHSLQNEPEGKATLAKLPSGKRKRSITPAHPRLTAVAAAAAAPHPAAAEAVAGMGPTAAVTAASAGVKRQRTPDTTAAASTKKVPSRRSSRLSATALDQSEDPQPEDNQPVAAEAVLTAKHAASADMPLGGGLQLNNAATGADDNPEHIVPTAAAAHAQASEVAAPADATAVPDTLDAAPTKAPARALDATHAVADPLHQAVVQQVADVTHNQPQSTASHSVRASYEVLLQGDDPAQADGHTLDQRTSGTPPAAASNIATGVHDSAPTACGKPPTQSNTDSSNTEGANATSAGNGATGEGDAADAHALAPIGSPDIAPLAPSVPDAQYLDLQEAEAPSSNAAAAAAPIGHASHAAQAAGAGGEPAPGESQAPDTAVAAVLGDAAQPAGTGLEPPSQSVGSPAEPKVVTKPAASPDTSSQHTARSDADMCVAAAAAVTPASLAEPVAEVPNISTPAAGASAVEAAESRPAVPAAPPASAAQAEGAASAQASSLAAPPYERMLRSAKIAATAAAAAPTAAAQSAAGADASPATADALTAAAAASVDALITAAADAASPATADPPTTAAADAAAAPPTTADAPTTAAAAAAPTAADDTAPRFTTTASPPTAALPTTADAEAPPAAAAPPLTAAAADTAPSITAASPSTVAPPATAAAPAKLKPVSIPKPPQSSGSTRIGLPHRPSSLSKSLLGAAQQKAGSTHIRPVLSKGLKPAPKHDRGGKAPHCSPSDVNTGAFFWSEELSELQGCLLHPHCHLLVKGRAKFAASAVNLQTSLFATIPACPLGSGCLVLAEPFNTIKHIHIFRWKVGKFCSACTAQSKDCPAERCLAI